MTIQRHVKGHRVRQHAASMKAAAVRVQARWRCHQAAAKFTRLRGATIVLQARAKGHAVRKHISTMALAVTRIQVCDPCRAAHTVPAASPSLFRFVCQQDMCACSQHQLTDTNLSHNNLKLWCDAVLGLIFGLHVQHFASVIKVNCSPKFVQPTAIGQACYWATLSWRLLNGNVAHTTSALNGNVAHTTSCPTTMTLIFTQALLCNLCIVVSQ